MLVLLFIIFLIQILTHWVFEPTVSFLTKVLEIKLLPIIALLIVVYFFSGKYKENSKNAG